MFLSFYCNLRSDLLYCVPVAIFKYAFVIPFLYRGEEVVKGALSGLIYAIVSTCFVLIAIYISKLHLNLNSKNEENVKLLDGMHEGLLILSKAQKRPLFCNSPIRKLINNFIGVSIEKWSDKHLNLPIFEGVSVNMDAQSVIGSTINYFNSTKRRMSLADIITLQVD